MKRTMQHAEQAERLQHAEIADEYGDRLAVAKVNAYEEPELAATFGIASVPAIVVLKNGKVVNTSVGYKPKEQILKLPTQEEI